MILADAATVLGGFGLLRLFGVVAIIGVVWLIFPFVVSSSLNALEKLPVKFRFTRQSRCAQFWMRAGLNTFLAK